MAHHHHKMVLLVYPETIIDQDNEGEPRINLILQVFHRALIEIGLQALFLRIQDHIDIERPFC